MRCSKFWYNTFTQNIKYSLDINPTSLLSLLFHPYLSSNYHSLDSKGRQVKNDLPFSCQIQKKLVKNHSIHCSFSFGNLWKYFSPFSSSSQINIHSQQPSAVAQSQSTSPFEWKILFLQDSLRSNLSSFGIGLSSSTWNGLSILFSWKRGDFLFQVPIILVPSVRNVTAQTSRLQTLLYHASTAYLGFIVKTIDTILQKVINDSDIFETSSSQENGGTDWNQKKGEYENQQRLLLKEEDNEDDEAIMKEIEKAKSEANKHKILMTRKAEQNKRLEESRNGLVILKATYGVHYVSNYSVVDQSTNKNGTTSIQDNDEGGEYMDATTQLQFWVTDSKLMLAEGSKSNMLGFYNITLNARRRNSSSKKMKKSWRGPFLSVRYKFNDQVFEIMVHDEEMLILPSPHAILVQA
jgi:hypothetical protein